jgi:hypothetical protein
MDDLKILDEQLSNLVAQAELVNETCGLKHSEEDPAENHGAVDFLTQRLGDPQITEIHEELRIPVCKECIEALYDEDWILAYCVNCHKSQWIYRPLAKKEYQPGNLIFWLDVCPFCAEIADKYQGE